MPNFNPEENLNTIIDISGGGEGGGKEKFKNGNLKKALCATASGSHFFKFTEL